MHEEGNKEIHARKTGPKNCHDKKNDNKEIRYEHCENQIDDEEDFKIIKSMFIFTYK